MEHGCVFDLECVKSMNKQKSLSVVFQINFTTSCSDFPACNLGFSLGKDTRCAQKSTEAPPPPQHTL